MFSSICHTSLFCFLFNSFPQCTVSIIERYRITFTANGKRQFVPRDWICSLLVVNCLLILNSFTPVSSMRASLKSAVLTSYLLFWKIVILNLTFAFAVNVILNLCNVLEGTYICVRNCSTFPNGVNGQGHFFDWIIHRNPILTVSRFIS